MKTLSGGVPRRNLVRLAVAIGLALLIGLCLTVGRTALGKAVRLDIREHPLDTRAECLAVIAAPFPRTLRIAYGRLQSSTCDYRLVVAGRFDSSETTDFALDIRRWADGSVAGRYFSASDPTYSYQKQAAGVAAVAWEWLGQPPERWLRTADIGHMAQAMTYCTYRLRAPTTVLVTAPSDGSAAGFMLVSGARTFGDGYVPPYQ